MNLNYIDLAKKYDLDASYVMTTMAVHSEVKRCYDKEKSPYYLYDEDEALEAIMEDMCNQASLAFKKSQEWEAKAHKLEKKLDEMGYYK